MKKLILMLIILVSILSLTSCTEDEKANTNVISETTLTDREKTFLSIGSDEYFVFDFNVDESYKWLEIWVERYELGKMVSDGGRLSTGLSMTKEGLFLITVKEDEKMKSDWTISIQSNGALYTGRSTQEYNADDEPVFAKTWGANNSENILINDNEIVLASICYKDQNKSSVMSSLTNDFYSNPDENLKEIEDYELVYLLKCKFYKNEKQYK
ncbi:hypothetical protein R9X47_20695 [Wukongibacter baidiensis]|uniref:hypothetical protein n=1 Tax=Wukongibacter baidiensis TaxID=1723361 RepID=UPI003D7F5A00